MSPHPSWAPIPCPCPSWRAGLPPCPRSRPPGRRHRPRPGQVVSATFGRMTGTPRMSAWNCISSVVVDHAAVHLEGGQRHAGVGLHGIQHLAGLVGGGFQGGAGDVAVGDVAGQADDDAAGIALPVGSEQAGEGRHEVDAAVVGHVPQRTLRRAWRNRRAQVVAQPLDQGAGDGDRAFQGVDAGSLPIL